MLLLFLWPVIIRCTVITVALHSTTVCYSCDSHAEGRLLPCWQRCSRDSGATTLLGGLEECPWLCHLQFGGMGDAWRLLQIFQVSLWSFCMTGHALEDTFFAARNPRKPLSPQYPWRGSGKGGGTEIIPKSRGSAFLVGTEAVRLLGVLLPVNPLKRESPFYMMAKVENAAFA